MHFSRIDFKVALMQCTGAESTEVMRGLFAECFLQLRSQSLYVHEAIVIFFLILVFSMLHQCLSKKGSHPY